MFIFDNAKTNEIKNTKKDMEQDVKIKSLQDAVDEINTSIAQIQSSITAISASIDDKYSAQTQALTEKVNEEIVTLKTAIASSVSTALVTAESGNIKNLSVTSKATVSEEDISSQTVTSQTVTNQTVDTSTVENLNAVSAVIDSIQVSVLNILNTLSGSALSFTSGTLETLVISSLATISNLVSEIAKISTTETNVISARDWRTPVGTPTNLELLKITIPSYSGVVHFITGNDAVSLTIYNNTFLTLNQSSLLLYRVKFLDSATELYFQGTDNTVNYKVLFAGSESTVETESEIVDKTGIENNINFLKGSFSSSNIHSGGTAQINYVVLTELPEGGETNTIYIIKNDRSYVWDEDNSAFIAMGGDVNAEASARETKDTELEAKITANTANITTNTADIATNTSSINTINQTISATKIRLTSDEGNISQNTADISTNRSDISAINAKIPSDASSANKMSTAADVTAERTYADSTFQKKLTAGSNISISEDEEISCDVSTMNFQGSKTTADELPESGDVGDVWNVTSTNQNYCWNGTEWIVIGSSVDISGITKVIPSAASETNKLVDNGSLNDALMNYPPVGSVIAFAGSSAPSGWLLCDGAEVSQTTYASLYAVIGDTYGTATEAGSFKLPNLCECTVVGVGTNNDYSITSHNALTLGQFQDDQLQGHWHCRGGGNSGGSHETVPGSYSATDIVTSAPTAFTPVSDGTNGTPRTGTTTHGKQVGMNYIIRY